ALPECLPTSAPPSGSADDSPPQSSPACRSRTALLHTPETPAAARATAPLAPTPQSSPPSRPRPAAPAPGNCSPACHPSVPSTTRPPLLRILLLFPSAPTGGATRLASAPSDRRPHCTR